MGNQFHLLFHIIPQRAAVFKAPYKRFFSERHPHYQHLIGTLVLLHPLNLSLLGIPFALVTFGARNDFIV